MAVVAQRVLDQAVDAAGTADGLAARMEPYLGKRYGNSAIYAYTNRRAVPPGDVLLAAALAAGISLDEQLGIRREPSEVERQMNELRAEMAQLHETVDGLKARLGEEPAVTAQSRAAERRAWARRSVASPPPAAPPPSRPPSRTRGM